MGRFGRIRTLVVTLSCAALVGCGTTRSLPPAGGLGLTATGGGGRQALGGGPTGPGQGATGPGQSPAGSSTGATGGAAATGAVGPGIFTPGAASGAGGAGGVGAAGGDTNTPGPKLPPIEIGTYYLNGGNAALAAAGFSGVVIPNNQPVFAAIVTYINAHGGLAGRQIDPVYYEYNEGGNGQAEDQAACADFTQDHHVYLVIGGINSGAGQLIPCLAQAGVPIIGANQDEDASWFETYHRYDYEPDQVNFTRGLTLLVADLQAQGWFAGAPKIGLVQYAGSTYDSAVDNGLVPALAALGLKPTDRISVDSSNDASISSGASDAELKFDTERINRVIFLAPGGLAQTLFMENANAQGYKPGYGIWSTDSPSVLAETAPPSQLEGSVGIGYFPGLDVAAAQDPTATTPAGKACLAFFQSIGETDQSGLNNALLRSACDIFEPLMHVMATTPDATTSTAALETGFNAIGDNYSPASTFATLFVAGRHDEADGYRQLAYTTSCRCFTYVGPTRLIQ